MIRLEAELGYDRLSPLQQLIYCVWVADYGIRNGGDLATAGDLFPPFQAEAERLALSLDLPRIRACFAQPVERLEQRFLTDFDGLCEELGPSAWRASA